MLVLEELKSSVHFDSLCVIQDVQYLYVEFHKRFPDGLVTPAGINVPEGPAIGKGQMRYRLKMLQVSSERRNKQCLSEQLGQQTY
jgi:hypothetical protein